MVGGFHRPVKFLHGLSNSWMGKGPADQKAQPLFYISFLLPELNASQLCNLSHTFNKHPGVLTTCQTQCEFWGCSREQGENPCPLGAYVLEGGTELDLQMAVI